MVNAYYVIETLVYQLPILLVAAAADTNRLDIDIGPGDFVDETTLSDVGVSTDDQSPGVRIDRG